MRKKVNRFAQYQGYRVHVRWEEGGFYHVRLVVSKPLPQGFLNNMTCPGRLEYAGDIAKDDPAFSFED